MVARSPGITWRTLVGLLALLASTPGHAELPDTVAKIKPSIVVVGTFNRLRSPQFVLRGTGFVVGDGSLIVTNSHVIAESGTGAGTETLAVLARSPDETQSREVRLLARDADHDLAILRLVGPPLPALKLRASETVREGQSVAFTGFPIGGALGFSPVTHRGVISSITPIVLPSGNAHQLNDVSIRRLRNGSFTIFQLDATAYPGNSGGPLYEIESGEVIGIINMVFIKESKEAVLEKPSGISYAIPSRFLIDLLGKTGP
jgi:S1-C subfamily serine protease